MPDRKKRISTQLLTVSEVMTRNVETVSKDTTVKEVWQRMANRGISCIIVEEQGHPVGIYTERDVVRLLAQKNESDADVELRKVMASSVVCMRPDVPLAEAIALMRSKRIRRFPVVDETGKLIGLVTQTDVLTGLQVELSNHAEDLERMVERRTEKIRELVEMKGRFLGLVVHDVRGPMCTINMFTEALLEGTVGELTKDQCTAIEHMRAAADASLDLINDFLDVSKIRSGRIELSSTPQDIGPLMARCYHENLIIAQRKEIDLELSTPGTMLMADVDGQRLVQVLNNLVSNAVKYSEAGARVTLEACEKDDHIEIAVQDTGLGIPKERMSKLFNEMHRKRLRGTGGEMGTGLGLVIVKKLVEMHHGTIEVESEPGVGSKFTVTLPLVGAGHRDDGCEVVSPEALTVAT